MGSERSTLRLSQLWQWPLLLISLGLFGYAAYLFIDPKPGPSLSQRLEVARECLRQERAEAAIERLNALLTGEKLEPKVEGAVRVLLGEALELAQRQKRLSIPVNHQRIIEQTKLGLALGIAGDAQVYRRLAESSESLGKVEEAILHYRQAMALDSTSLRWQRRVIELQLGQEDSSGAAGSIDEYLKHEDLANSERAWAMGQKARLLVDQGEFDEARQLITRAMKLAGDEPGEQGQFYYWLGYCEWKLGRNGEAERLLRVARDLLRVQHPLDAEAAYALGRIRHEQKDYAGANAFYAAVLQSHLDAAVAPSARLARGVCRIALGENDGGLNDLEELARRVMDKPTTSNRLRQEAIARIQEAMRLLAEREQYQAALELMAYEQELQPKLPADFFGRLGGLYEKRAAQLEKGLEEANLQERLARQQQAREGRTKAGDAYVAWSKALTLKDDKGHGQALWKAIELYEKAAELPRVISALETFVAERPDDPQTPDALLKLGQSYQAAGLFDKAIEAYRQNQFRYPKSLAASKSGVPLARAYIAKGPEFYGKAEGALLAVVENNPQITPEAEEFRESLWELANLYYRTNRFEPAIARLEEMTQRYPNDGRMGQLFFVMADSYRKSAGILDERLAAAKVGPTTQPSIDVAEATRARGDRLRRAKGLYDRTIEHYRAAGVGRELDKLYLKLSHFYRGDCVYDLGDYAEAIKLYGDAAFRYQDDSLALAAYVQIVNSNVALGKTEEAKAANERAKWMLRRMPAEAFTDSSFGMPKPYWEQWLRWSSESGMWK